MSHRSLPLPTEHPPLFTNLSSLVGSCRLFPTYHIYIHNIYMYTDTMFFNNINRILLDIS